MGYSGERWAALARRNQREVRWIRRGTQSGRDITSAIPPVFETYATVELPPFGKPEANAMHAETIVNLLRAQNADKRWLLGYLDTGNSDVVFETARRIELYPTWEYVLVEAGAEQALTWRVGSEWPEAAEPKEWLPDLIFPLDRSWLFRTLWDDSWSCVGGAAALISSLAGHPLLENLTREVALGVDMTPPGHKMY